jgi:hypothetical protein
MTIAECEELSKLVSEPPDTLSIDEIRRIRFLWARYSVYMEGRYQHIIRNMEGSR